MTATALVSGYRPLTASRTAKIRWAKAATVMRFSTPARLYLYDTLLEWLPPALQDVAAARRPCIQAAHPVVREGHLARHRDVAPA